MQVASQSVDQAVSASTKFAAAASQGVESLTKASAAAAKKATAV